MSRKKLFNGEEKFSDFRYSLRALRDAADRKTRIRVVYGDQVIRVE